MNTRHEDEKAKRNRGPERTPEPAERSTDDVAHTAVNDPKASKGSDFARGRNTSGEGNDPSLVHGPSRVRKVPPDPDDDEKGETR